VGLGRPDHGEVVDHERDLFDRRADRFDVYGQPPLRDVVFEERVRDLQVRGHLLGQRPPVQGRPVEIEVPLDLVALAQADLVDALGSGDTVEDEQLFERPLDALFEPVRCVECVFEPLVGHQPGWRARDDLGTEVVRQRRGSVDGVVRRGYLQSDARLGGLDRRRDVQFVAESDGRWMAAVRRERPFGRGGLERGPERADRVHHVDRVVGRRDGCGRPVVPGDRPDFHVSGTAKVDLDLDEVRSDLDRPLDDDVGFDLCTQLEDVRTLVDRLGVEVSDFGYHLAGLVPDADADDVREHEFLGRHPNRAVDREQKAVGPSRCRGDGLRGTKPVPESFDRVYDFDSRRVRERFEREYLLSVCHP